jgi:hypothetical protein
MTIAAVALLTAEQAFLYASGSNTEEGEAVWLKVQSVMLYM